MVEEEQGRGPRPGEVAAKHKKWENNNREPRKVKERVRLDNFGNPVKSPLPVSQAWGLK